MQTQVTTCNHMKLKEIILETNQAFMTEISENFEGTFFHLIFFGLPFFCFFKILKALHKFELISAPHGNCFKKIDYFWKSCFQILVFGRAQVKWLQTRKRKLQEIQKSSDKVVKDCREICSQLLCW